MAQEVILKETELIGVYVHSLSKINRKALDRNYVLSKPFSSIPRTDKLLNHNPQGA